MVKSGSSESPGQQQTDEALQSLANFSEDDLKKLYSAGEVQQFGAGEIALTEGGTDTSVYIILEGQAEVAIPRGNGWFNIATLKPGAVFGELSFFDRMPRSARVSATLDCTVLKISEAAFQQLRVQDSGMALAFVLELSRVVSLRLRRTNSLVQALIK